MLVVIGLIAVLASLLFPVFVRAREMAHRTVCLSNLRQVGLAVQMYAADHDDQLPYGGDPCDLYTDGWVGTGYSLQAFQMQPLNEVLAPYITQPAIWHCPSDTGYTNCSASHGPYLDTRPSAYREYGMSYLYNTQITLRHIPLSSLTSYDPTPPYTEHGPQGTVLLGDATGDWHGGGLAGTPLYNVLFADGHARVLNAVQERRLWDRTFTPPTGM